MVLYAKNSMIHRLIKICKNCILYFKMLFGIDPKQRNWTQYIILMKNILRKVKLETDF